MMKEDLKEEKDMANEATNSAKIEEQFADEEIKVVSGRGHTNLYRARHRGRYRNYRYPRFDSYEQSQRGHNYQNCRMRSHGK